MTPTVGAFADLTVQTMPLVAFAQAVAERGFVSMFLNEHTHLPVDAPTSRFPPGGAIPERYARFWTRRSRCRSWLRRHCSRSAPVCR